MTDPSKKKEEEPARIDEMDSDGSAGAFEGTETVSDEAEEDDGEKAGVTVED